MTVRVRIAPSPTGNFHIGTARTAVFNWLFARRQGGQFIVRIEDTDTERSKAEFTENILEGLKWLGLNWDEGPFYQSQRIERYREAVQTLLDRGLAYRCYCTPEELETMREAQKARQEAPRYDNRHRNLKAEQEAAFVAEGRKPVIRFKIEDEREIIWSDQIRGQVVWKGRDLGGDMVIARTPEGDEVFGQPLYNLAVVVDDIDMQISHVIRGEDHIANTAKQILLYEALGGTVPVFAHTPLILNQEGRKLSKRDGVTSISDFQGMGFLPDAIANYMTLLGWTPPEGSPEIFSLSEAAQQFELDRVSKAGAKFDWQKLDWINSQYLHNMPPDQLVDLLIPQWQGAGYAFDPVADRDWLVELAALVAHSLTRLTDAVAEACLLFGDSITLNEAAQEQLKLDGAREILQAVLSGLEGAENLTPEAAKSLINQVTKAQKVKKGLVMKSLRAGLTGEVQGPDLIQAWVLLHQKGWDKSRLTQALKSL
ncbi:glutamate--tRNA ligase [Spirulina subsalsa]|uniref:glutamate--tRNA ligase n=1 Tax=Spirulina subsalsa TaxID=54311 RepID=UPI00030FA863|nr:glutamate--tRNA ligase [Spirulina subsalsa]